MSIKLIREAVVKSRALEESAIKDIKRGAFHKWLGKPEGEKITAADIAKGKAAGGHAAKMAVFAQNFGHVEESLTEEQVLTETDQGSLAAHHTSKDGSQYELHKRNKQYGKVKEYHAIIQTHDHIGELPHRSVRHVGQPKYVSKHWDKILKEDNLEELSKKTLGSYINKAAANAADKASEGGWKHAKSDDDGLENGEKEDKKAYSRLQGIKKATKKLTK